jgi:antitoxin (DNA-binding transcriptional repressor) of toxin-antitoxin stability system
VITRRGHPVAHILPALRPRKPLPLQELAAFRATMPRLRRPSAELLREARDEGF